MLILINISSTIQVVQNFNNYKYFSLNFRQLKKIVVKHFPILAQKSNNLIKTQCL